MSLPSWIANRLRKAPAAVLPQGVLCVTVSESGWQTTLLREGEAPLHGSSPEVAGGTPPTPPLDMVRRAIRTITTGQREQIGSVRLLVADPALVLVDNRLTRVRTTDPVALRQAGAQELGCADAVYGFQPYGVSGEQEAERGVFAFMSTTLARDYIGGLDSLAARLVELQPVQFVRLAGAEDRPFISLTVGSTTSDLMIGDPESGAMTSRVLPLGTQTFAKALAEATSMPLRQAAEGLARRNCLPSLQDGPTGMPATATERALRPLAELLRTELLASLDYMRFQRLGNTPELLLLGGEYDGIRGLQAWLEQLLPIEMQPVADAHDAFVKTPGAASANMLEGSAKGLLKIGKSEYRFEGGRFVSDQPTATRAATPQKSGTRRSPVQAGRDWLAGLDKRKAALPLAISGMGVAAVLLAMAQSGTARQDGLTALAEAVGEDAALRGSILRHLTADANRQPEPLFLTEKLVAIARALPDSVWLDRVATFVDGPASPRDNRLTVEGSVAAAGADYLGRINALIERLTADKVFMNGVAAVALSNAVMAPGREGGVATFTLTVSLKPLPSPARRA